MKYIEKILNEYAIRYIVCCLFLMVISVSCSYAAWLKINNIDIVSYHKDENIYDISILGGDNVGFVLYPVDDKLIRYDISIKNESGSAGMITANIYDKNIFLFSQEVFLSGEIDDVISLSLENINLDKGKEYRLCFQGDLLEQIKVELGRKGELNNVQYFEFADSLVYKEVLIFINVCLIIIFLISPVLRIKIHIFFLSISLFIGGLFMIVNPPLTVPDEFRHFVREYEIVKGNIISEQYSEKDEWWVGSGYLPESDFPSELVDIKYINSNSSESYAAESVDKVFFEKWKDLFWNKFSGETVTTIYHGTSNISPFAYLPQILGIWMTKILFNRPVILFYGARLGSLIINSLIICLAIRKIPCFKILIFVIGMLPSVVCARSSCSTDGFLLALILLYIAIIFDVKCRNSLNWKDYVLIAGVTFLIANIKIPYLACCGLILLINNIKNNDCKIKFFNYESKIKKIWIVQIVFMIISLFCYLQMQVILKSFIPEKLASSNMLYLKEHFFEVINLVIQTFINNINQYIIGAFGCIGLIYLVGIIIIVQYDKQPELNIYDRWLLGSILIILLGGLTFAGYFMAPPLGDRIWGLQDRYFIPVLPILFILLSKGNGIKISGLKGGEICARLLISGGALLSLMMLCFRFYF